jgi:hypothetical protein
VSHDIEAPPWARRAGERDTPYPKQELLGLAQLPLTLPHNAILALSMHPTVCDERAYAAHYSSYGKDDTWPALALRGFYDEPERIEKPSEMNRRWKSEHEKELDREPRDTPLRATLGPAAEKILAALPRAGFERIRLMRLAPGGGEVSRHADMTDPDAGASEGKVVCVHIPLISNERCVFQSWGLAGAFGVAVLVAGFVAAGRYASPEEFSEGFAAALGACAGAFAARRARGPRAARPTSRRRGCSDTGRSRARRVCVLEIGVLTGTVAALCSPEAATVQAGATRARATRLAEAEGLAVCGSPASTLIGCPFRGAGYPVRSPDS